MVTVQNHLGTIEISYKYLSSLIWNTASSCFGVVDMNSAGAKQNFLSLIKKDKETDRGVLIYYRKNKLLIELHITVSYGTNISAVVDSIVNKVKYTVEEHTGIHVGKINVYIDKMRG